jgi:ParB family chromosome partitioning protein
MTSRQQRRTLEDFKADIQAKGLQPAANPLSAAAVETTATESAPAAAIAAMNITRIPLDQLHVDAVNVRKINREAGPEFVASVARQGIRLPLIVRKNGQGFAVTDGGKRLSAATQCVAAGTLPKDYAAPCIIEGLSDAEAREISGMLNLIRDPMHPVDQFRFFADLHRDKDRPLSEAAIAERFALPLKDVQRRLALGMLADPILDAWRDGTIDDEIAQAFTMAPSKKAQADLFAKLTKKGDALYGRMNRFTVRRALGVSDVQVVRMLDLVTETAYVKRGGKLHRDLFDNDAVIISDQKLLKQMVDETVKAKVAELTAAGWSFVTVGRPNDQYRYGDLPTPKFKPSAEQKEALIAMEAELIRLRDASETDSDDEREQELAQRADDQADELSERIDALQSTIAATAYPAEQMKKAGCFVILDHDGRLVIEYGKVKPADKAEVRRAVETVTRKAAGGAHKPKAASTISNALTLRLGEQLDKATREALLIDPPQRWPGASGALAVLATKLIANQIHRGSQQMYGNVTPYEVGRAAPALRDAITPKVMNEALRKHFDATDYFGNAPKSFVLRAIEEALGEAERKKIAGRKKAEIAKHATANVPKTGWLPTQLRTSHYDGPGAKPATKAKKPAAKKAAKRKSK